MAVAIGTEAALAAYLGGIVDRVVQLSNGEYEVHYIGVNWPHHIFVNQAFQVVGAQLAATAEQDRLGRVFKAGLRERVGTEIVTTHQLAGGCRRRP